MGKRTRPWLLPSQFRLHVYHGQTQRRSRQCSHSTYTRKSQVHFYGKYPKIRCCELNPILSYCVSTRPLPSPSIFSSRLHPHQNGTRYTTVKAVSIFNYTVAPHSLFLHTCRTASLSTPRARLPSGDVGTTLRLILLHLELL